MGDGSRKYIHTQRAGSVCVCERGSGVPPAAVCRLGVHGGWAEWKAQPTRREHLARHQLCTGHARLPGRHSPNTQALTIKTTPNKHLPNTLTTCGRAEGGASHGRGAGVLCLLPMPLPARPCWRPEMERPFKTTWKIVWLEVTQNFHLLNF